MLLAATLSALLALATSGAANPTATSSDGTLELVILHNNDMHARFEQTSRLSGVCSPADRDAGKCYGGFARVAHVVKEARVAAQEGRAPHVLYLNAGDTYTGTPWFTLFKWQIAAEFINALHPDAVSLGNHEFDNGVSGLTPFIENLQSPVLAANLELTKVPELAMEANLLKSAVFNISGVKVGVIGYLTPDTKFLALHNDVEYIDEIVALKEEVARLKGNGVNILIALGHSGWLTDLKIAREVDDIDLVIGGHTNTFLWNGTAPDAENIQGPYPTMVRQSSGRMVPAVQAYAYTKYLGKLHLTFDADGEIVSYDGNPILLNSSVRQDPEVVAIIERYRENVTRITEEVVGTTSVFLDGSSCRLNECNLGNLIADSLMYNYAINYNGTRWTDAPISIIQGGGIRASIDTATRPGEVTMGDLMLVLPFETFQIFALTMNGTVLMQVLEHSVSDYRTLSAPGQFLQYSGIRVTYDLAREPGQRVVEAVARCWDCFVPQYYEIEAGRDYKVLMPQFLADGGDGYSMLPALPRDDPALDGREAVADYLRRRSPVYPEVADRVVLLNEVAEEAGAEGEEEETEGGAGAGGGASVAAPSAAIVLLASLAFSLVQL